MTNFASCLPLSSNDVGFTSYPRASLGALVLANLVQVESATVEFYPCLLQLPGEGCEKKHWPVTFWVTVFVKQSLFRLWPIFMHLHGQPNKGSIVGRSTIMGSCGFPNTTQTPLYPASRRLKCQIKVQQGQERLDGFSVRKDRTEETSVENPLPELPVVHRCISCAKFRPKLVLGTMLALGGKRIL